MLKCFITHWYTIIFFLITNTFLQLVRIYGRQTVVHVFVQTVHSACVFIMLCLHCHFCVLWFAYLC